MKAILEVDPRIQIYVYVHTCKHIYTCALIYAYISQQQHNIITISSTSLLAHTYDTQLAKLFKPTVVLCSWQSTSHPNNQPGRLVFN